MRPSTTSADRPRALPSSFSNKRVWSPSAHGAVASCAVVNGSSGTCRASSPRSRQHQPRRRLGDRRREPGPRPVRGVPAGRADHAPRRCRRAPRPRPRHRHVRRPPHVRYIDGSPAIISDDYFDLRLVEGTELAAPEDTTREDILKEAGYEQTYDVDEIITRMPTPEETGSTRHPARHTGRRTPPRRLHRRGPTCPTNDLRRPRRQHRPALRRRDLTAAASHGGARRVQLLPSCSRRRPAGAARRCA